MIGGPSEIKVTVDWVAESWWITPEHREGRMTAGTGRGVYAVVQKERFGIFAAVPKAEYADDPEQGRSLIPTTVRSS